MFSDSSQQLRSGREADSLSGSPATNARYDAPTRARASDDERTSVPLLAAASVHAFDGLRVELQQIPTTDAAFFHMSASRAVLNQLSVTQREGVLELRVAAGRRAPNGDGLAVVLALPFVPRLGVHGTAQLHGDRLSGSRLSVTASEEARVALAGRFDAWQIRLSDRSQALLQIDSEAAVEIALAAHAMAHLEGSASHLTLSALGSSQLRATIPDFVASATHITLGGAARVRLCSGEPVAGTIGGNAFLELSAPGCG